METDERKYVNIGAAINDGNSASNVNAQRRQLSVPLVETTLSARPESYSSRRALTWLRYVRSPYRGRNVVTNRGDYMLRLFAFLAALIFVHTAGAQDQQPPFGGAAIPPTDLQSGIGNYCIYESLVYSIGSPICVGKTSYVCVPTTSSMGFNQRGYWTPRPPDPNLLAPPACQ